MGAFEYDDVCGLAHAVFLQIDQPITLNWKSDGISRITRIHPGQVSVIPAYLPHSVHSNNAGEFLAVCFEQKFLAGVAAESGAFTETDLRLVHADNDPLVRELLLSFKAEAENHHAEGPLFAESLATTLAAHLLRKYSVRGPKVRDCSGGLSRHQLRRTIDFIHEELAKDITLGHLASVARLSPFHFARQFKRSTGLAPHEYVTRRRVERAKELLLHPLANIADVALQVGFCDQSHLARHFKRHYGLTPASFARNGARR